MATTAIFDMRFKPESAQEGLRAAMAAVKDTRAFQGNEGVQVVVDDTDPCHVAIIESWSNREADDAYQAWRAGGGAPAELVAMLAEPPAHTVWTVSARL
jgi:quinol monooxygenase YgiN